MISEQDALLWAGRFAFVILSFLLAKLSKKLFGKYLEKIDKMAESKGIKQLDLTTHTIQLLKTIFGYVAYIIAFVVSLYILGLKDILVAFVTSAGIAGLAIGFASKDIVANVMSGILVIFDRPFEIGDSIQLGSISGKVKEITIRSTKIETFDGKIVSVPNSKIATDSIINYSKNSQRRIELNIDVDIDSNIKKALKVIDKVVDRLEWKSKSKSSSILISDVNKEAVIISIKVWTKNESLGDKKTWLYAEITEALKKNKIRFSVPRRINITSRF